MNLKVHHISSQSLQAIKCVVESMFYMLGKCVCPLQIVYAYLASGGFTPDPHGGSDPGPRWGTSPRHSVPTLPPNPGYATGLYTVNRSITRRLQRSGLDVCT